MLSASRPARTPRPPVGISASGKGQAPFISAPGTEAEESIQSAKAQILMEASRRQPTVAHLFRRTHPPAAKGSEVDCLPACSGTFSKGFDEHS
eukprot:scaffold97_cov261-Pinguiococcus_pyrenoidosus.AAC.19